jgi:hypothetical protein
MTIRIMMCRIRFPRDEVRISSASCSNFQVTSLSSPSYVSCNIGYPFFLAVNALTEFMARTRANDEVTTAISFNQSVKI